MVFYFRFCVFSCLFLHGFFWVNYPKKHKSNEDANPLLAKRLRNHERSGGAARSRSPWRAGFGPPATSAQWSLSSSTMGPALGPSRSAPYLGAAQASSSLRIHACIATSSLVGREGPGGRMSERPHIPPPCSLEGCAYPQGERRHSASEGRPGLPLGLVPGRRSSWSPRPVPTWMSSRSTGRVTGHASRWWAPS